MKIRINTVATGFVATIKREKAKETKISVNDPQIKARMAKLKELAQRIVSEECGVPDLLRNSRTRITDLFNATSATPEQILKTLERLRDTTGKDSDETVLNADFGPALATFLKSDEYQSALAEAKSAGARVREVPTAKVWVDVLLRPEEDAFWFGGAVPEDIRQKVNVTRDIPTDILPVVAAAKFVNRYEKDLYDELEHQSNRRQRTMLTKAKSQLETDIDTVLRSVFPETEDGKNAVTAFESTIRADMKVIDDALNSHGWYIRTYVKPLVEPEEFLKRAGFGVYTERLMGGSTVPVILTRDDKDADIDVDNI